MLVKMNNKYCIDIIKRQKKLRKIKLKSTSKLKRISSMNLLANIFTQHNAYIAI